MAPTTTITIFFELLKKTYPWTPCEEVDNGSGLKKPWITTPLHNINYRQSTTQKKSSKLACIMRVQISVILKCYPQYIYPYGIDDSLPKRKFLSPHDEWSWKEKRREMKENELFLRALNLEPFRM